ncbi:DUF1206 domain-containing protein [Mycobacterium sp. 236(2023)]|uniref:DUF1206 domain-containing protein n=1 Tax=Mycobacterium sp. 236(2023) TaxID=3038163 RepID=UPI0024156323|nr:DUF1206 domain-containing protein [Mycobacterium sp. 236(2023)]MDG4663695.1 DUF1206 domain-containing protein [Mycobacterium sp. 236(2023)]
MTFKGAVNRATESRTVEWLARIGYPVNGLLHLLIAATIGRIAFGLAGDADQTGALATLAEQPGGSWSLWVVAFGMLALAMWRLAETVVGLHPGEHANAHRRDVPLINRLKAFGLALVYLLLSFTAVQFALGVGRQGGERAEGLSARLMQTGGGKAILVAIGAAVVAFGGYFVYKGAWRKFLADLRVSGGPVVTVLGVCGHVAEGLVLIAAGVLIAGTAVLHDPAQARGLDAAVEALGEAQFGQTILLVAAAGFAAYGLYSFALTRYSRM